MNNLTNHRPAKSDLFRFGLQIYGIIGLIYNKLTIFLQKFCHTTPPQKISVLIHAPISHRGYSIFTPGGVLKGSCAGQKWANKQKSMPKNLFYLKLYYNFTFSMAAQRHGFATFLPPLKQPSTSKN